MTALPLPAVADDRTLFFPLPVEVYHAMIGRAIEEGEPFELLRGQVLRKDSSHEGDDPVSIYPPHTISVLSLGRLDRLLEPLGCHMRPEQPLTLGLHDEPEPDGAIVIGAMRDYRERHPGPGDVLMVIEVADSSLHRDRTLKHRIYAGAGIERYVILNLIDRVAEVYTQPLRELERYGRLETLGPGDELALPTARDETLTVRVGELLP